MAIERKNFKRSTLDIIYLIAKINSNLWCIFTEPIPPRHSGPNSNLKYLDQGPLGKVVIGQNLFICM